MGRFLIQFSYIGTHYRGMQIQREAGKVLTAVKTVQGVLEENLRILNPVNEVTVKNSSRTDSSVHALCNACDVELIHRRHPVEFNPQWITVRLNKALIKSNERLRILSTYRVPDDFASRMAATERSYVYRLALVKTTNAFMDPASKGLPWTAQDCEQSYRVYPPFDMDLFLKAAEILSGKHNFLSFSTKNFLRTGRKIHPEAEMKIRVQRGCAVMEEHRHGVSEVIDHWEVHFHGYSFLYKQVRRMIGAMVAVARGRMSMEQLRHCLDHPSLSNPGRIEALPGRGLTLKEVHYPESVFHFHKERDIEDQETGPEVLHPDEQTPDTRNRELKEMLQETVPVSLSLNTSLADMESVYRKLGTSLRRNLSASQCTVSDVDGNGSDCVETGTPDEKPVSESPHIFTSLADEESGASPQKHNLSASLHAASDLADFKETGTLLQMTVSALSHVDSDLNDSGSDCAEISLKETVRSPHVNSNLTQPVAEVFHFHKERDREDQETGPEVLHPDEQTADTGYRELKEMLQETVQASLSLNTSLADMESEYIQEFGDITAKKFVSITVYCL